MDIKHRNHFRPLDPDDFDRMNIGRAYWNVKLSSIPDEYPYKARLIEYIDNLGENLIQGNGFLFWGQGGTGKTAAAAILSMATVAYNHTYTQLNNRSYFITATEVRNIMQFGDWDAKQELKDTLQSADLFVVDDLGMEWESQYSTNIVESLVRLRLNSGKSLVVTTNLPRSKMDERYGVSFLKLLMDGGCVPTKLNQDWRDKNVADFLNKLDENGESGGDNE